MADGLTRLGNDKKKKKAKGPNHSVAGLGGWVGVVGGGEGGRREIAG